MCSFDMNKTDYKLFLFLINKKRELTTNQISEKIGLDRTSIQKSIKRLVEKTLVLRSQTNLEKGGYLFSYKIKDKELIKKQILDIINSWNRKVNNEIEKW